MKKAALIIGKPNSGKSTTIRNFKELVEMESYRIFVLNGKRGFIFLTSFEEADRDIEETVEKLSGYDFLVFACQGTKLNEVHAALKRASFMIHDINVHAVTGDFSKVKKDNAMEAFQFFMSN